MIHYFRALYDDKYPGMLDPLKPTVHGDIYRMFRFSRDLITKNINNTRKKPFLERFKQFLKFNDILVFSFVRHPFER